MSDTLAAKVGASLVGGMLGMAFASIQGVLSVLITMMICDTAVGVLAACSDHKTKFELSILFEGWSRKIITVIIIFAVAVLQVNLTLLTDFNVPAAQTIGGGYCLVELASMIRNAAKSGVDMGPLNPLMDGLRRAMKLTPTASDVATANISGTDGG